MKLATEAPINGGRNYDGPKVNRKASLSKTWPYAGKSEYPTLLVLKKGSDNVVGADDQQERLKTVGWVVGFVDGEGCFSVAVQRCRVMRLGWQVLLPLSVLNLLLAAVVIALGWPWWVSGALGLAALIVVGLVYYVRLRRALPVTRPVRDVAGLALPDSVRLVRVESQVPAENGEGGAAARVIEAAGR